MQTPFLLVWHLWKSWERSWNTTASLSCSPTANEIIQLFFQCRLITWFLNHQHGFKQTLYPFGWGCRMLTASLQRVKTPFPDQCSGYGTKLSDGEVPVMLELWGMWNTFSLPLLRGSLWPGVVAPDKVLSMGQIELNYVLMLNWIA